MLAILGISLGAALGALLRWRLGILFNVAEHPFPLGTLAANLLGGYLIGLAITFFARSPALAPEWRLFAITGFLGGLTTFSTFSAEVTAQIQVGRLVWAGTTIACHVIGSLCMTLLGIATLGWFTNK